VCFLKIMFLNEDDLHCIAERATRRFFYILVIAVF
jgi:hypothetical protein